MSYMRDLLGRRLDEFAVAGIGDVVRQVNASRGKDWRSISPVTTDITSITQTSAGDGTLSNQYVLAANSAGVPCMMDAATSNGLTATLIQ